MTVTLDSELERQLAPIAKPEHLADIAERGYSPAELKRLAERQPLRGKVVSKIQTELEHEAAISAQLTGKRPTMLPDDADVEMLEAGTPTRVRAGGAKEFPAISGLSLRAKMADSWPEKVDIKRTLIARGAAAAAAEAERAQQGESTEREGQANDQAEGATRADEAPTAQE